MNKLQESWRNLRFWQRVAIDCAVAVFVSVIVDLIFFGRSIDFAWAIIGGGVCGFLYAIIDDGIFPPKHDRRKRRRTGKAE